MWKKITWCPEQIDPFGTRTRNGLCTGHDVRGPHLDRDGNGTELKVFELHGLHNGGGILDTGGGGGGPLNGIELGPPISDVPGRLPGPKPWWHIGTTQFCIGHGPPPLCCMPLLLPQCVSAAKLSWLPEHWSRCGRGGDDCRE